MPHTQRPIEVYTNPHGDIVLRQTRPAGEAEGLIVVDRAAVQALVQRLLDEARRTLD